MSVPKRLWEYLGKINMNLGKMAKKEKEEENTLVEVDDSPPPEVHFAAAILFREAMRKQANQLTILMINKNNPDSRVKIEVSISVTDDVKEMIERTGGKVELVDSATGDKPDDFSPLPGMRKNDLN